MNTKKLNLKFKPTPRGFLRADFLDMYGMKTSIQKSSLATDDAIWLGSDEATHSRNGLIIDAEEEGIDCSARMHLNQEQVKELIPILEYFVKTGELPPPRVSRKRK